MSQHTNISTGRLTREPLQGLVSIVIASYGRPELVKRAIDSALSQSYPHIEVIVADDLAADHCHAEVQGVKDPRFRFHLQDGRVGCWQNWTTAIRMARGEFIVFLGDDDWLSPTFVEDHLVALAKVINAEVSFCSMHEILEDTSTLRTIDPGVPILNEVSATDFLSAALRHELFFGAALFRAGMAMEVWEETKPDDYVADYGLILRLAVLRSVPCTRVSGPVYFKSVHPGQLSQKYTEVTQLRLGLLLRIRDLIPDGKRRRMVSHFAAHEAILLARHHAAAGDLQTARRQLAAALQISPSTAHAWSQFLQSYLTPSRLARTARTQRGLPA